MPPRKKKSAAQTLSAHIDDSSDNGTSVEEGFHLSFSRPASEGFISKANVGLVPKKAPAKRASRAKASTTVVKKAPPVARGRNRAVVGEPTEDEVDPIEDDDEVEETVVVNEPEAEAEPRKRGGRKAVAKPEPAKKEPSRKRGAAAIEETTAPAPKKKRMSKKEKDAAAKEETEREIAETQYPPEEADSPLDHSAAEEELEIAPTPTQVHKAGIKKGKPAPVGNTKGKGKGKKGEEPAVEESHNEEEDDLAKPTKVLDAVIPLSRGRGKKNVASEDGEVGGEAYKDLKKQYQALQTRYNNLQEAKETEAEQALKKFQKNMKEKDEGLWFFSHYILSNFSGY